MAKPLRFKVTGVKELQKNLRRLEKLMPSALDAAMYREGLQIMRTSVRRVPVDFGRLRSTHFVAPPSVESPAEVRMGYGTDYALAVHENLKAKHTVGEAKYLEKPVNEAAPGMLNRIGDDAFNLWLQGKGLNTVGTQGIPQKPREAKADKKRRTKKRPQRRRRS